MDRLKRADTVGVAWGSTVSGVVKALEVLGGSAARRSRPVQFVPVCGEVLGMAPTERSASALADELNKILNDGRGKRITLGGVPALIPMTPQDSDVLAARKFIEHVEGFAAVFGMPGWRRRGRPWIERLDAILTSFSDSSQPQGFWDKELAVSGNLRMRKLRGSVVGDIAGALIPRNRQSRAALADIDARWLGITIEQIAQCASRARVTGQPGVIIVAHPAAQEAEHRGAWRS